MAGASLRQARRAFTIIGIASSLALVSCSGPDEFGDAPETPIVQSTPTATIQATPTEEPQATPTEEPVVTPTSEASADETPASDGSTTETPAVDVTPGAIGTPAAPADGTPDPNASPPAGNDATPTAEALNPMDALPRLEDLTAGSYVVANQGERSSEQLAGAYADPTAHLLRLDEWGFKQHVFREFTKAEGAVEALPAYVLATVNVYGSPEQADLALQWLEDFQVNQGAQSVEAPDLGDAAVAVTLPTRDGEQTASVYIRLGPSTYIYYAEGNDPLPEVVAIAGHVFDRMDGDNQRAGGRWSR